MFPIFVYNHSNNVAVIYNTYALVISGLWRLTHTYIKCIYIPVSLLIQASNVTTCLGEGNYTRIEQWIVISGLKSMFRSEAQRRTRHVGGHIGNMATGPGSPIIITHDSGIRWQPVAQWQWVVNSIVGAFQLQKCLVWRILEHGCGATTCGNLRTIRCRL